MAAVLAMGSIVYVLIDELKIPEQLEWFNPFSLSGLTNLMFNFSNYFANGGTAMLTEYAAVVGGFLFLLLLGSSALLLGRRGRLRQPGLRLLIVLLAVSLPSFALERRHGEFVTVPASETLDDTLLATGTTVRVEGVVNGDLLAFAGTVEVRGTVKGDLVSFAASTLFRNRSTWTGNWVTASTAGRNPFAWMTGAMWAKVSWLAPARSVSRAR
jgi:hypothetical protein